MYTVNSKGSYKPSNADTLAQFKAMQGQANRHLAAADRSLLVCDGIIGEKTHSAVQNILGMSLPRVRLADDPGRYTGDLANLAESKHFGPVKCPSKAITKYVRPMPKVNADGTVEYQTEGLGGIPYWVIALGLAGGFYAHQKKQGVKKPFKVF